MGRERLRPPALGPGKQKALLLIVSEEGWNPRRSQCSLARKTREEELIRTEENKNQTRSGLNVRSRYPTETKPSSGAAAADSSK